MLRKIQTKPFKGLSGDNVITPSQFTSYVSSVFGNKVLTPNPSDISVVQVIPTDAYLALNNIGEIDPFSYRGSNPTTTSVSNVFSKYGGLILAVAAGFLIFRSKR